MAWGVLVVSLVSSLGLSVVSLTDSNMIQVLLLFIPCMLVFLVALIWLMIAYRSLFRKWLGWVIPILLLFVGNFPSDQPMISPIQTILIIASIVAMFVATLIMLYYRDTGLKIFACISLVYIWGLVLVWRSQGNLLDLWIKSLSDPTASSALWFLNTLGCITTCLVPLSLMGFLGHTLRLLWQELRGSVTESRG